MPNKSVIETEGLTKYYGKVRGLEGLNLTVYEGEIFGYLGPNGAGKTTTIRLLLDLIRPTAGRASVFGLDCQKESLAIRQRVSYLPGDVALYEGLTGREYLNFMSRFNPNHNHKKGNELAERLELDISRKISGYSKGMKQKLAFILALVNEPELLILDEPTLSLDPLVQQQVYALLSEEQAKGRTIFFSSHNLPEVERVCQRAGILRDGHLVAVEDVTALKQVRIRHYQVTFASSANLDSLPLLGFEITSRHGRQVAFEVRGDVDPFIKAMSQYPVEDLSEHETTLEEVFLRFYGGGNKS